MKKPYNTTNPAQLTPEQIDKIRVRAAQKAGVPVDKIVGPFGPNDVPGHVGGLFLRISKRTGQLVWAYRSVSAWGKFSTNADNALRMKGRSSRNSLMWVGYAG